MRHRILLVGLVGAPALLAGCIDNINDVGAVNRCDTAVQVESAELADGFGRFRHDIPPGQSLYLGSFGDRSTVYIRLGVPLDDPEAVLDDATPVLAYEWDELIEATPEEQEAGGYETYFVVEGDLCP